MVHNILVVEGIESGSSVSETAMAKHVRLLQIDSVFPVSLMCQNLAS